jgi:alkylhydroperoxidase/carboxymuconolactone decarboxylase family protein YurZ
MTSACAAWVRPHRDIFTRCLIKQPARCASDQEIMEVIWVAAEMRAGGAFAHSTVALHALDEERQ